MSQNTSRPTRLVEIESLPPEMADFALVDWKTAAWLTGNADVETAREMIIDAGVPLVHLNSRRKLPRWGVLREFLLKREKTLTA